jgi:hypothetical protein
MRADESDHHVDELIDEVARSMTQAEPSPLLRDGVRARIAETSPDRGRVPGAWAWKSGLAAASIAIVLVVVARDGSSPLPEPGVGQLAQDIPLRARTDAGGVGIADVGQNASMPSAGSERRRAATARRVSTATARFQTALPDEPAEELPFPAVEVETVAIEPLTADAVMLETIELPMPLQVQRLNIDPVVLQ